MKIWIAVSVFLFFLCVVLLFFIWGIKRALKNFKEELALTRDKSYNRQLTVSLFDEDLTELAKELNRNLDYQKQLKLETERSEGRLKQSVSDIAHDLRTPLTVIKGNLQMMNRDGSMKETDAVYLAICKEKTDSLRNMVDDFFEMSVLESDSTPAVLTEVDVTNVLVQFVVDHEALIRERGLEPEISLPEKSIVILADEKMLLRMLSNLLNNVIKYAEKYFRIELQEISTDGKTVCRLRFANAVSPGREPEAAHLFDRTYRGSQARQGEGAGLGLFIVKLLAQKQGMEVFADMEEQELVVGMEKCVMLYDTKELE